MGGLFRKPDKPDIPPPQAIPEVDREGIKRGLRRKGGRGEMITGELAPETTKKSLLG